MKSVRVGDPLAPVIAWGYVLFMLTLLALVTLAGAMHLRHVSAQGQSVDPTSVAVIAGFLLAIAAGCLPMLFIGRRLHRITVNDDGSWKLSNPFGGTRTLLAPGALRSLHMWGYQQLMWHAGGTAASVRRRAELHIRVGGTTYVGHTNDGTKFTLEGLGYDLTQHVTVGQDEGLHVAPHRFVHGAVEFAQDQT